MSIIYWGSQPQEIPAGSLSDILSGLNVADNRITLDTEASGLFVDGNWSNNDVNDCQPPARVSVVSIAWKEYVSDMCGRCYGEMVGVLVNQGHHSKCQGDPQVQYLELRSLAMPFDQGRIGGKAGKWDYEEDRFEILPHTEDCQSAWHDGTLRDGECICAPWNLNVDDWFALCEWLQQFVIDFHNAKYDLHIMNAGLREKIASDSGINLEDQFEWDSMLVQGLVTPLESTSLKPTCGRLFGEDSRAEETALKEALKKNGPGLTKRYDLVDWSIVGPYAGKDAELTYRLRDWQVHMIEMGELEKYEVELLRGEFGEFELAKTLYHMELRRAGVDIEQMSIETEKLIKESERLKKTLPFTDLKGNHCVNVNSARRYFFGELGIAPIKVTDVCELCTYNRAKKAQRKNTKKPLCAKNAHVWTPGLDGEVAARLAADKVPHADTWVQLAQIDSALAKWYRAWPKKAVKTPEGWRVMTNYRQGRVESDKPGGKDGGSISGRLSAERVQLQGFPDDYRIPSFITPPKKLIRGKVAYCSECQQTTQRVVDELDVSNAEVRVAAWLMKSPSLAKACATGNVHSANTVTMAEALELVKTFPGGWPEGVPYGEWWRDEEGNIKLDKEGKRQYLLEQHPQWGQYRKIMKTTVLGLFFGAGIRTLRKQIEKATTKDFPESKVKMFRDMTLKVIPEWKDVSNRMQRKADKGMGGVGYIKLVNGRKRWFHWTEHTHKAFNAGTQGGVAETMKRFMIWVDKTYPGILINQVHDSLWLEMCPCVADRWLKEIKAEGERLFTETFSTPELHIPFELDSKRLA